MKFAADQNILLSFCFTLQKRSQLHSCKWMCVLMRSISLSRRSHMVDNCCIQTMLYYLCRGRIKREQCQNKRSRERKNHMRLHNTVNSRVCGQLGPQPRSCVITCDFTRECSVKSHVIWPFSCSFIWSLFSFEPIYSNIHAYMHITLRISRNPTSLLILKATR